MESETNTKNETIVTETIEPTVELDSETIKKNKKNAYSRKYYESYKAKLQTHNKYVCECCKCEVTWWNKSKHMKSKKHLQNEQLMTELNKLKEEKESLQNEVAKKEQGNLYVYDFVTKAFLPVIMK